MQRIAARDLDEALLWAARHAPHAAHAWAERFEIAIHSLGHMAERCPIAPESRRLGRQVRQFVFGRRSGAFRVLFEIDDPVVRVMRIRRASRRILKPHELEELEGE
jgi:plasmid stabilization system protein ParE